MHVLITGASGFLGSVCCHLLSHHTHLRLSLLRSGQRAQRVGTNAPQFDASTSKTSHDLLQLIGDAYPTHIIHSGALASPEASERDPALAYAANVAFTKMLTEYAGLVGAHLTTISTDLVFDGCKAPAGGLLESDTPNPISVYGKTKWEAELSTLTTSTNAVVRLSLLYGHAHSESTGALGWMERSFAERTPLSLFEDEFRTPIHVRDAADALIRISLQRLSGIWHCGGPARLSRVEFGTKVARALNYNEELITPTLRQDHATKPIRPEDVSLNSHKLWSELKWKPEAVHEALIRYPKV